MRPLAFIVALSSPFLFPFALSIVLIFIAACVLPPVGILAGILIDALYSTSAVSVPYGTITGAMVSIVGYVVHRFVKTRIID